MNHHCLLVPKHMENACVQGLNRLLIQCVLFRVANIVAAYFCEGADARLYRQVSYFCSTHVQVAIIE